MIRRLVSLGHLASEDHQQQQLMPTSPGDDQQNHHPAREPKAGSVGGLAGVFRGLTGSSKMAKSPPVLQQPFVSLAGSQALAHRSDAGPASPIPYGLSSEQAELFHHLKNGQLSERVAAANSLRYVIVDFPLNPVRANQESYPTYPKC